MRIGIYGGTFSPPHRGHCLAAAAFCEQISLDKLLIIPANIPPHKFFANEVEAVDRIEMCKLAFSEIPCAQISDVEIKRGGRSYTYLTLEELYSESDDIFLLCGTDMILTFDEWKEFRKIFDMVSVCYVRRESDPDCQRRIEQKVAEYRERYNAKIYPVYHNVLDISSSEIRDAILRGDGAEQYLDARVYAYIRERGLYR